MREKFIKEKIDEEEKKMVEISIKYRKCMSKIITEGEFGTDKRLYEPSPELLKIYSLSIENFSEEKRFILRVNYVLSTLCPNYRNIIINDYLFIGMKNWWMESYSRSTYYRAKKRACYEFLSVF